MTRKKFPIYSADVRIITYILTCTRMTDDKSVVPTTKVIKTVLEHAGICGKILQYKKAEGFSNDSKKFEVVMKKDGKSYETIRNIAESILKQSKPGARVLSGQKSDTQHFGNANNICLPAHDHKTALMWAIRWLQGDSRAFEVVRDYGAESLEDYLAMVLMDLVINSEERKKCQSTE